MLLFMFVFEGQFQIINFNDKKSWAYLRDPALLIFRLELQDCLSSLL